jgi:glycosyltransferase involved in cell wall biosynthesis
VEVVVIDDGSTDETPAVLDGYQDRIRWARQENAGLPAARNAGHRLATGGFIAWLDADDICEPDRLALQVDFLLQHEAIQLVATDFSSFRDAGLTASRFGATYYAQIGEAPEGLASLYESRAKFVPARREWLHHNWDAISTFRGQVWSHITWGNFVHPPTVMFRRGLLDRVGGLDAAAAPEADWDFFIRASKEGEFGHLDQPLLQYRLSPGQMSGPRNAKASILGQLHVLRKTHIPSPAWPARLKELWRQRHARLYAGLAREEAENDRWAALGYFSLALAHRHPFRFLIAVLVLMLLPAWATRSLRAIKKMVARGPVSPHLLLFLACAVG